MTTDEAIQQLKNIVEHAKDLENSTFSVSYEEARLFGQRVIVARPALAHLLEEVERLRRRCEKMEDALSNIVRSEPAMQEGRCFYPQFDGDGNEVGTVDVDPISLVQEMAHIAAEALLDDPAAEAARKGAGK